ncbi:PD40 domain-containing protein [Jatrophihabitans sp. GAS493]|uniref:TolB family protein n=1 Tax=Jatrophihabitans sp. GAS493 TaxID=1907575 RepID=UPI0012FE0D2A|nr:PD40 domain-containing protein [Jatrophihabitans sp. GAS493]
MKARIAALVAICVLAIGAAVIYLVRSHSTQTEAVQHAAPVKTTSPATIQAEPHIVYRNTALGTQYGMVAMSALSAPAGPRAITSTSCDRVYAASSKILCLSSKIGIVTTYAAAVLNDDMTKVQNLPLSGIPSRARLSADGSYAASTSFISGDSYAGTSFSTRTILSKVGSTESSNLESYTLIHNGQSIHPVDENFWGVTFAADGDTFYVTAEWAQHTWLSRGSISKHQIVTLHEDAECPSLSPDGSTIVYKQRGNLPSGHWRLVRYDIASGKVTPLAETRSIDDQVAWLDDSTVMYGVPRSGSQAAVDDVWKVPADGTGSPVLLIPQAWSPAVVR